MEDHCILESFRATCGNDEVILMTHALYGRMRIGKCVKDGKLIIISTFFGHDLIKQQHMLYRTVPNIIVFAPT